MINRKLTPMERRYWKELHKQSLYEDLGLYGIENKLKMFCKLENSSQHKFLGKLIQQNKINITLQGVE